ncbi:MAG TPA: hypothetical protein PLC80_08830 [Draconibacterium sp.]|nr:hypothetical protein [Draconibacterium sp.]
MEKLKFMRPATIFLISILTIVIIISCGNDDEVPPEYVGKWVTEKPIPGTHGFFSVKYYLELTQNDFKETFGTPYSSDTQISLEGTVSVSGNILKLIIHKLSISNYDSTSGAVSEPYETRTYKDEDFGSEFNYVRITSNHEVEYSFVDGKLILKVDENLDGIYSESEEYIYSKQ